MRIPVVMIWGCEVISKFAVISMVAMMPCFVEADKMVMGIIAGNTVNVRTAPSAKSASKCVLPIGADVYIQRYEKDERVIDGKKRRWAFVETDIIEKGLDTYSGWVFDYYIRSNKKIGATGFNSMLYSASPTSVKLLTSPRVGEVK